MSGEIAFELPIYFLIAEEEFSFPESFVNAKYIYFNLFTSFEQQCIFWQVKTSLSFYPEENPLGDNLTYACCKMFLAHHRSCIHLVVKVKQCF